MNTNERKNCDNCTHSRDGFCVIGKMPAKQFRDLEPRLGGCGEPALLFNVEPLLPSHPRDFERKAIAAYSWA